MLFRDENEGQEVGADDMDALLAEAEARNLEVGYYRSFIGADLFGEEGVGDPIAERVQERIAGFCKQEIARILGVGGAEPRAPEARARLGQLAELSEEEVRVLRAFLGGLSEQEVKVMRAVAARMAVDPTAVGSLLRPAVKPVAAPAKPAPKAVPTRPAPRVAPTAARRPAPSKPAPKAVAKTEPPEEKGTGDERRGDHGTPLARLKSPTARPFPRDNFGSASERVAQSAVSTADRQIAQANRAMMTTTDQKPYVDGGEGQS